GFVEQGARACRAVDCSRASPSLVGASRWEGPPPYATCQLCRLKKVRVKGMLGHARACSGMLTRYNATRYHGSSSTVNMSLPAIETALPVEGAGRKMAIFATNMSGRRSTLLYDMVAA